MAKQLRIDHFNHWPKLQDFRAEVDFRKRLEQFETNQLFFPYQIPPTTNKDIHIVISYLLDAIDSLPSRPDHAFDWTWRAFEYLATTSFGNGNITNSMRSVAANVLSPYFNSNSNAASGLYNLIENIPIQTCEYLLKRIIESGPYTFAPGTHNNLTSYSKRLLFANGNPPVISTALQTALAHLSVCYDYADTTQRRNGASLLRKILHREQVALAGGSVKLTPDDLVFFLLSGLGYAFRNDRAHAKSIAPFRSSYASIKTYAHCWFMFLLMYEIAFSLLHTPQSPHQLTGCPGQNFFDNNYAFTKLFKNHLGR
ncbi:hypothetical protein KP001_06205 [Geomonas subterranea]|uniref:Uncharacterized protein n=1 Tax=Geomonas subterranea TaxID=2847989 RepID=A0ABX8LK91_9BACT|nr:hypothetical protein [Geomonas subterranea]QXE92117.1 hypothetical protein KP001_06205 [Geomonas subterranea]QXM09787.1 hypothetical protein KP002_01290 [Geomonas subterranea]